VPGTHGLVFGPWLGGAPVGSAPTAQAADAELLSQSNAPWITPVDCSPCVVVYGPVGVKVKLLSGCTFEMKSPQLNVEGGEPGVVVVPSTIMPVVSPDGCSVAAEAGAVPANGTSSAASNAPASAAAPMRALIHRDRTLVTRLEPPDPPGCAPFHRSESSCAATPPRVCASPSRRGSRPPPAGTPSTRGC